MVQKKTYVKAVRHAWYEGTIIVVIFRVYQPTLTGQLKRHENSDRPRSRYYRGLSRYKQLVEPSKKYFTVDVS